MAGLEKLGKRLDAIVEKVAQGRPLLLGQEDKEASPSFLYLPDGSTHPVTPPPVVEVVAAPLAPSPTRQRVLESLQLLADWMGGPEGERELEDKAAQAIDKVIKDHAARTKIFLVGLSHHKIQGILRMTQLVDKVADELDSRPIDAVSMSTYTLILLFNALKSKLDTDVTFVREIAEAGYPTTYDDPAARRRTEEKAISKGATSPLTPTGRGKLESLMGSVRRVLEERGSELPS